MDDQRRLLLIDGHSMAYRAFFALPKENFQTGTGQYTNAVYGFTSMLINLLRDEKPTHVAVAFDLSRQTFRAEVYPEYKANRSASPDEFKGQVSLIQDVLAQLRIPVITKENYEADDVMGALTARETVDPVEVVSGDRDMFQVVRYKPTPATVWYVGRGWNKVEAIGPAELAAKYDLPTEDTGPRYADMAV
ncbi:DNA polymerase I, partial [Kibdelosporangium lantanae]